MQWESASCRQLRVEPMQQLAVIAYDEGVLKGVDLQVVSSAHICSLPEMYPPNMCQGDLVEQSSGACSHLPQCVLLLGEQFDSPE